MWRAFGFGSSDNNNGSNHTGQSGGGQSSSSSSESQRRRRISTLNTSGESDATEGGAPTGATTRQREDRGSVLPYVYESCIKAGFDPDDGADKIDKECQDNCLIFESMLDDPRHSFVCVFDGHGQNGRKVSTWMVNNMIRLMQASSNFNPRNMTQNLKLTFKDASFAAEAEMAKLNFDTQLSGTTATYVMLTDSEVHCGWVGDSRAVMCRRTRSGGVKAVALVADHKPGDFKEKMRIRKNGGEVRYLDPDEVDDPGPLRVFARNYAAPGLAMSRSIGDRLATSLGAWPKPSFRKVRITDDDELVIVASDGLWEVFENDEASKWCWDYVTRYREADGSPPGHLPSSQRLTCAQAIAEEAQQRWVTRYNSEVVVDDTTVCVVYLKKWILHNGPSNSSKDRRTSIHVDHSALKR